MQRCQADARQSLQVKPAMAWSHAQQALGRPGTLVAVKDEAAPDAAYLTLAEICFISGLRNTRLAPELGRPDLFAEAYRAAASARRFGLASILDVIGRVHRAAARNCLSVLAELAQTLPRHKGEIEPWLQVALVSCSLFPF